MHRIEAAQTVHAAVDWLLDTLAPDRYGLVFLVSAAATWWGLKLHAAHRTVEAHRRQLRAERAVVAEAHRIVHTAAADQDDSIREEKP